MKKLKYLICVFALIFLVGCSQNGYKEGEYTGTAIDSYGGQENTASAKVTINSEGKITDVYLDTTYTTKDGVSTTKKTLGADYNMMSNPNAAGEWFEQVEKLEQAVVDNQGVDFLNLNDEGKTDAVSGCTIVIDAMYEALENALEQAK